MKMIPNALGRLIPDEIDGKKLKPFQGAHATHGGGRKAGPPIRASVDYTNKMRATIDEAIDACNIKDGMTVSFHHHLRNGDYLINMVLERLEARGLKDLVLAPSALFPIHQPIVDLIEKGVVSHIEGSMNGPVGRACSLGRMKKACVLRSHGGR
ncbi:MAG TPA: citrate lyase subunit alpha, partial [Candidatus Eisenbacteria bacterium]|nr:citrate lyase subunit alpha [Candidatus Eisenbacteria bacterium]